MNNCLHYLTGGKVLLSYKQENAPDHVDNDDVLKALGLPRGEGADASPKEGASDNSTKGAEAGAAPKVVCDEDVCRLEK